MSCSRCPKMKINHIRAEFVEFIPEHIEEGVLYISEPYGTAIHRCCCGCGKEVVTPLSPAEWSIQRTGNQISLWPSVGNWSFPCRSHYVIRRNRVLEAGAMTERQIRKVKARDRADKEMWIAETNCQKAAATQRPTSRPTKAQKIVELLQRVLDWWRSL